MTVGNGDIVQMGFDLFDVLVVHVYVVFVLFIFVCCFVPVCIAMNFGVLPIKSDWVRFQILIVINHNPNYNLIIRLSNQDRIVRIHTVVTPPL